jgi:hypothetical protein
MWLALACLAACTSTPPLTPAPPRPAGPITAVKAYITTPGVYAVTFDQLRAQGLEVGPARLRLSFLGQAWPMWVEGETVRFYAETVPNLYSPETAYWFSLEGEPRAVPWMESGAASAPIAAYTATTRFEQNLLYYPQVQDGDHWLWQAINTKQTLTLPLTLTNAAQGEALISVEAWSNTFGPEAVDHHLQLALNGTVIADQGWDGATSHTFTVTVPAGAWQAQNTLTIFSVGDTGMVADRVWLNAVTVQYPHRLVAEGDHLALSDVAGSVRLGGFTTPVDVWDVTQPLSATLVKHSDPDGDVTFAAQLGRRYWLQARAQTPAPARLSPAFLTPDLHDPAQSADYVAIGPPALLTAIQPLLDYHTTEGWRAQAIPIEAIYDQFGNGQVDPLAIQSWLRARAVRPRAVLLLGDTTYDPYGYTVPLGRNRLPSVFIYAEHGGQTTSDVPLFDVDGDDRPDVAFGRVPANTPAQAALWAQKTLAYLREAPAGEWRMKIVAVADGQEAQFAASAQEFLNLFPLPYTSTLITAAPDTANVNAPVEAAWNAGAWMMAYFGHGSLTQWGKDKFFTAEEVARLTNGARAPVVINMTCLTGFFAHPTIESLTETLLWQPRGGAVAVLAPTSLTLPGDQSYLAKAVAEALIQHPDTLGEAVLAAQRSIPLEYEGAQEVLLTFWLFGDPALNLVKP